MNTNEVIEGICNDLTELEEEGHKQLGIKDLRLFNLNDTAAAFEHALREVLALDEVAPTDFFHSQSDWRRFVYSLLEKATTQRRQTRTCIWPQCSRLAKMSHTLSRRGPLHAIAENGHVLTPRINIETGQYEMHKIGVGRASTFPGFCCNHEQLFGAFENRGQLAAPAHISMQTVRTIFREIVTNELGLTCLDCTLQAYQSLLCERGTELLQAAMNKYLPQSLLGRMHITSTASTDGAIAIVTREISERKAYLDLLWHFLNRALDDLSGNKECLMHVAVTVNQPLPACLAGMGNFDVRDGKTSRRIHAVLNTWVTTDNSVIFITVKRSHKRYLLHYLSNYLDGQLFGPLSLIESWMVHGTDHWFVQPSMWEQLPFSRRRRILRDMSADKYNLGEQYLIPIFDGIRADTLRLSTDDTRT
ncbi:MAG: hypothetical protein IH984_07060 [Planctomycetes bacterium]|nr:hypothetical protein [Planctomycetota bacterium]